MSESPSDRQRLYNVEFASDGIYELDGETCAVFIERARVRRIGVGRGITSERPVLSVAVGGMLVLIGIIVMFEMTLPGMGALISLGRWGRLAAVPIVFFAMGALLAWQGLRRGVYLWVDLGNETRRLRLARHVDAANVRTGLREIGETMGYEVDQASVEGLSGDRP